MKRKFTFLIAAAFMLLTMMASTGTMWGQTYTLASSLSDLTDGTYCIAAYYNSKYYTVPNTTISGQTFSCTEATYGNNVLTPATGHGQFVFTSVSGVDNAYYIYNTNLQKYLVATGSKTFGYVTDTSTDYGYWTFSAVTSGGFSGVFSVQHSSKTHYMRAYNNSVRCYDGASNQGVYLFVQASTPSVAAPTFNPAAGSYTETQNVTISCATTGASIYYTTNGNTPDNNSTPYTGPISVTETTTIKAIAYVGTDASSVATATYNIVQPLTAMDAIFAAATAAGGTATPVVITCNNWVVTGIKGSNAYVTDGTKGFIVYQSSHGFAVGDVLNGTVSCNVQLYKGASEITSLTATTSGLTVTTGGTVTPVTNISIADLSGVNTGAVFSYGNLTYNGTNLVDENNNSIKPYSTFYSYSFQTDHVYNVTGVYIQYDSTKELAPRSAADIEEVVGEPSITLAQYEYNLNADGGDAVLPVTYTNMPANPQASVLFYQSDGTTPATYNWISASINGSYNIAGHLDVNTGDARSAYFKVKGIDANSNEVYSNLVTINQAAAGPNIEFNNTSMTLEAGGESGRMLSFDYSGLGNNPTFSINYYEQDGTTAATYDHTWLTAEIEDDKVNISAVANTGAARTAYFKVYGENGGVNAESNLVTINQAAYVVDYATLPFEWTSEFGTAPTGVTNYGVGTGGSGENAYLKFDGSGDYIILKINETPGVLSFDVKGNPGSDGWAGIFKVQYSVDGTTYTDLATYNNLPTDSYESVSISSLSGNVRYIKWIYDTKTKGNVALKNISLDEYVVPQPAITVESTTITAPADETDGTLNVTYTAIETDLGVEIYWFESDGTTAATEPDWISTDINSELNVEYLIEENSGAERTAYFKVYGLDGELNDIYSDLVTVTQEAGSTPPASGWILTDLANLTDSDVFVIVGNNGETYAMSNNNGTSNPPAAVAVTVVGDALSAEPNDNLKWNISGDATNGYVFYPNGDDESWLYCTNTNNGVRVGTNNNNTFKLDGSGYLKHDGTKRYVGIYSSQDWRCYSDYSGNIANQTFAFYRHVGDPTAALITVNPSTVNAQFTETVGALTVTYQNVETSVGVDIIWYSDENASTALTEAPEWIDADFDTDLNIEYIIEENDGASRTAYFKVYGVDADANDVYSNLVTVSQAAFVADYATLPFEFDGGKAEIDATSGLTQDGIEDKDYNVSPKLKFNNTNDWMILKLNAAPASLSYDLKGYSVASDGGTFTVQTSTDGQTYDNLVVHSTSSLNDVVTSFTFIDLASDVRYIKWIYTNKSTGNVGLGNIHATEHYDTYGDVTFSNLDLTTSSQSLIIHDGSVVTVTGTLTNDSPDNLLIHDGGQLYHNNSVAASMEKTIEGVTNWHNENDHGGGWYLLSSPIGMQSAYGLETVVNLAPEAVAGVPQFDLFTYNEPNVQWMNFNHNSYTVYKGQGFLYARHEGATLKFSGTLPVANTELSPSSNPKLEYTEANGDMAGWNLIGNPYSHNITWNNFTSTGYINTSGYYRMVDGAWITEASKTAEIKPMEGFLVKATGDNPYIMIKNTPSSKDNTDNDFVEFIVNSANHYDVTYAMFSEGEGLEKISHRNTDIPMVYIPKDGERYAIATMGDNTEAFNLNFKAMTTGRYTLKMKANSEYSYLHVIDRLTGEDVDMLLNGEYTFIGSPRDDENRFIVRLNANSNFGADNDIFAYQNGSEIIVSGEGELQIFDVMGRFVMSRTINGNESINTATFNTGVYVLRMVGETVKTQKIVVK